MGARALTVLFVSFLLAAAEGQGGGKEKADALQGTWNVVAVFDKDGRRVALKDVAEPPPLTAIVFEGSTGVLKFRNEDQKFSCQLDATKKPKTMDRTPSDGPQKGKMLPGIYALEGDKLTICVTLTGTERPTELATKAKSGRVLSVFQRDK